MEWRWRRQTYQSSALHGIIGPCRKAVVVVVVVHCNKQTGGVSCRGGTDEARQRQTDRHRQRGHSDSGLRDEQVWPPLHPLQRQVNVQGAGEAKGVGMGVKQEPEATKNARAAEDRCARPQVGGTCR